jgi:hypothetical protein
VEVAEGGVEGDTEEEAEGGEGKAAEGGRREIDWRCLRVVKRRVVEDKEEGNFENQTCTHTRTRARAYIHMATHKIFQTPLRMALPKNLV